MKPVREPAGHFAGCMPSGPRIDVALSLERHDDVFRPAHSAPTRHARSLAYPQKGYATTTKLSKETLGQHPVSTLRLVGQKGSYRVDLSQYVAALRKRWYLIVALAVLGGLGAYGSARATPPTYESTAKVLVSLSSAATPGELAQGSTYIKNIVESYAALASLPVVLEPVIADLGLNVSASSLSPSISAESPLSTNLIDIQVTSTSPEVSAQLANAVARQLSRTVGDLSPGGASSRQSVSINVVAPATAPSFASAPRTRFLVVSGTGVGLALGALLAVLLALLDTRVREARDVDFLGESAAVLASIPVQPRRKHSAVATLVDPLSPRSEAYRRLQTNLTYIDATSPMQIILVTSATLGEGKTSTAINLAISMGETSRRVLLIDVDLRRPSVAQSMGIEGAVGLTTVLVGRADIGDVIQPMGEMRVDVLAAGEIPPILTSSSSPKQCATFLTRPGSGTTRSSSTHLRSCQSLMQLCFRNWPTGPCSSSDASGCGSVMSEAPSTTSPPLVPALPDSS